MGATIPVQRLVLPTFGGPVNQHPRTSLTRPPLRLITNEGYFLVESLSCPRTASRVTVTLVVQYPTGAGDAAPADRGIRHRVYPNPFNPSINISFTVPLAGKNTRVEIFDAAGRSVKTVYSGTLTVGEHTMVWDGRNSAGERTASGIYVYRITVGHSSVSGKMTLIK